MIDYKKTFNKLKSNKTSNKLHNKKENIEHNNYMEKNLKNTNCKIHSMPSAITDQDISALFEGLISIIKRKVEIDNKAKILESNFSNEKLLRELNAKKAECNRLKNEILYLKQKLNQHEKV